MTSSIPDISNLSDVLIDDVDDAEHSFSDAQPSVPPPAPRTAQLTGQPTTFTFGQFEGQTIGATLEELQAADVGRKYSRKDRRPLDPPPIVALKLFLIKDGGTSEEIPVETIRPEGFVCHLDLFAHEQDQEPGLMPITQQLAGSTFVQAYNLALTGLPQLFFPFTDVSVRQEGTFKLRFRAFNIMCTSEGDSQYPILAECYGTPFRVYSTKEFPGLSTSTEMTQVSFRRSQLVFSAAPKRSQRLAIMGVRVNNRTVERKRRRGGDGENSEEE